MRYLADENFPSPLIRELRRLGHDVLSAMESLSGSSDVEVLRQAVHQDRVLLTLDKDFGELAFHAQLPVPTGIVLFRLTGSSPTTDNQRILAVLQSRQDWAGAFSVVTDDLIRMRQLPR